MAVSPDWSRPDGGDSTVTWPNYVQHASWFNVGYYLSLVPPSFTLLYVYFGTQNVMIDHILDERAIGEATYMNTVDEGRIIQNCQLLRKLTD